MNRRMRGPHVRWCERGRGNPGPYSIANQPCHVLELGHVEVQVHPIDALQLQGHMLREDLRHGV